MLSWLDFALEQLHALSVWEIAAVLLAVAYLLLAMRENILCWYCAFFSTAIYIFLFWEVSLLMDSALNVYYLLMAVYGWYQWTGKDKGSNSVSIRKLNAAYNGLIILSIFALTLVSGWLLNQHTDAAWPYIDSFTTWGSIVTTIMVAKKILENWLYWIVIDGISIPLYIDRGLYLTACLFMIYLIIVVCGYIKWRQIMSANQPVTMHA